MASNKRKSGAAFSQNSNGRSVVVVKGFESGGESFQMQDLHKLHEYLSAEDPLLNEMEGLEEVTSRSTELQKKSSEIKSCLAQQLGQELDACEHASRVLVDLESQVQQMKQAQKTLVQEIDTLGRTQIELQRDISKYQEEASHEIVSIDQVEEEQKRLVPRLKTQVSLYASTTGIRWDFAQDEILSGQVSIAKTAALQSFCIDPRDYSSVETANRLWSMIDVGQ